MRIVRRTVLISSLFIFGVALAACGSRDASTGSSAKNVSNRSSQLKCGSTSYNLSADRIDTEVNEACDRLNKSYKLHQSNRDRARFTCQDAKGHIVASILVPDALLPDYGKSCQEFTAADAAFENGIADRQVHFDALKRFQSETNQLTRQTVDEANVVWRQNRADQATLNRLIKNRGGTIEIEN